MELRFFLESKIFIVEWLSRQQTPHSYVVDFFRFVSECLKESRHALLAVEDQK
jgi:hypothetical protein